MMYFQNRAPGADRDNGRALASERRGLIKEEGLKEGDFESRPGWIVAEGPAASALTGSEDQLRMTEDRVDRAARGHAGGRSLPFLLCPGLTARMRRKTAGDRSTHLSGAERSLGGSRLGAGQRRAGAGTAEACFSSADGFGLDETNRRGGNLCRDRPAIGHRLEGARSWEAGRWNPRGTARC